MKKYSYLIALILLISSCKTMEPALKQVSCPKNTACTKHFNCKEWYLILNPFKQYNATRRSC